MVKRLPNIHPREMLEEEFLNPLKLSARRLAKETRMPYARVLSILKGKGRVTADTALRLSKFFGTTPDFWLGLQAEYDLRRERELKSGEISLIPSFGSLEIRL